jgi:hypothetical protein
MNPFSRREFLASAGALAAVAGLSAGACTGAAGPVRMWRVVTPSGVTWLPCDRGWPTLDAAFRRGQVLEAREIAGCSLVV